MIELNDAESVKDVQLDRDVHKGSYLDVKAPKDDLLGVKLDKNMTQNKYLEEVKVNLKVPDSGYIEDSYNDYMIFYQFGQREIEDNSAIRARNLAALKRLYCLEYDCGTWL